MAKNDTKSKKSIKYPAFGFQNSFATKYAQNLTKGNICKNYLI